MSILVQRECSHRGDAGKRGTGRSAGIAGAMVKAALAAAAVSASPIVPSILSNLCKTMFTKKLIAIAAITATVVLPTALIWKQNRDLRREIAELRPVASEADRLRAENAALARSQIDTNELARLKAGQSELLRLRGQFARLRQQPASPSGQQSKPAPGDTPSESTHATHVFNSSVKARIPAGRTLAVGGWSHEPGKRAIALVVPTVGVAPAGPGQITITATLVEMPDEVWDRLGLSSQNTGNVQNPLESILDAEQARSFFITLTNNAGVNIVGSPRVTTSGGIPATISTSDPDKGTSQSFSLLPSLTADSKEVDLQMDMEITSIASSTNGAAQNGGN